MGGICVVCSISENIDSISGADQNGRFASKYNLHQAGLALESDGVVSKWAKMYIVLNQLGTSCSLWLEKNRPVFDYIYVAFLEMPSHHQTTNKLNIGHVRRQAKYLKYYPVFKWLRQLDPLTRSHMTIWSLTAALQGVVYLI